MILQYVSFLWSLIISDMWMSWFYFYASHVETQDMLTIHLVDYPPSAQRNVVHSGTGRKHQGSVCWSLKRIAAAGDPKTETSHMWLWRWCPLLFCIHVLPGKKNLHEGVLCSKLLTVQEWGSDWYLQNLVKKLFMWAHACNLNCWDGRILGLTGQLP